MLSLRVLGGRSLAWTSQGSVPPGAHFLAYSCAPWLLAPACTSRPALHLPLSSSQLFSDFFFHFTLLRTLLRVGDGAVSFCLPHFHCLSCYSLKRTAVSPDITSIFEGEGVEQVSRTAPAGSQSFYQKSKMFPRSVPTDSFDISWVRSGSLTESSCKGGW